MPAGNVAPSAPRASASRSWTPAGRMIGATAPPSAAASRAPIPSVNTSAVGVPRPSASASASIRARSAGADGVDLFPGDPKVLAPVGEGLEWNISRVPGYRFLKQLEVTDQPPTTETNVRLELP